MKSRVEHTNKSPSNKLKFKIMKNGKMEKWKNLKNEERSLIWRTKSLYQLIFFSTPHFPRNLHTRSLPPLSLPFSPISIQIPSDLLHSPHTFPLFPPISGMTFLRPFLFYSSLRWMTFHSWGFPRWPSFDAFLRFLVLLILWSMLLEIHSIPSSSMYPTLRVGDRILVETVIFFKLGFVFICRIMCLIFFFFKFQTSTRF